jgi:hypothetical protein
LKLGDLALKARKGWWAEWRMNLAVKTRCAFILNCAKRSLDGRLVYNHHRGELSVRVSPIPVVSQITHLSLTRRVEENTGPGRQRGIDC